MNKYSFRAHTNIALIKYWGKRNTRLFLPMTSSLSLTLKEFYTETQIAWNDSQADDHFILNKVPQDEKSRQAVTKFVDLFRQLTGIQRPVQIISHNHVPTAAGLASSASAFAALAACCNQLFETDFDLQTLSTYARQGSGSASRSIFGGFTLWHRGHGDDSASSYAEMIDDAQWDIGMVVIILNQNKKEISSRQGMEHTIQTSPFYQLWPDTVAEDLALMLPAIQNRDFTTMGEVAEHNAMKMHASMIAAKPSLTYWEPDSIRAMQMVRELRKNGIEAYFTMDAGPNVKVLCRLSQAQIISKYFNQYFSADQIIVTRPGPGVHPLEAQDETL